jgi:predicted dehydrogenase
VSAGDAVADSYGEFKLLVRDGDIVSPKVEPSEPLKNQCADFVAAIGGGRPPLATGRFGTSVVRALVAIEASMRSRGAAVEV